MKLQFWQEIVMCGGKTYNILTPTFDLAGIYIGEYQRADYMLFANGSQLRKLAALFHLIGTFRQSILYLPLKKNGVTKYIANWFWDSKGNDLLLFHHSIQLNIHIWKQLRNKVSQKGSCISIEINEEQYLNLPRKEYDSFQFRENKDCLLIKRKFDTIFLIGSRKVFTYMSGCLLPLAKEGAAYFKKYGGHDHIHMDLFLCQKSGQFCIDFYDEKLWSTKYGE
ncbi:hypothetical protein [Thermoflavimicrobium dichotomicum]|uniref:Uncharacterized protein n=1 Tax=Thermoflavimicrobium dichotomicum TaxID=46223 RepID=A0A1I3N9I9_9BACL|nr:hypothetical protein [Thermoflavimicrobium dichotomicum]SFJ05904.1 hypothetical protein SAMN05421852_10452 [Thermoflavimicrobium dichotomicum]